MSHFKIGANLLRRWTGIGQDLSIPEYQSCSFALLVIKLFSTNSPLLLLHLYESLNYGSVYRNMKICKILITGGTRLSQIQKLNLCGSKDQITRFLYE